MNLKKRILILVVTLVCVSLAAPSVWAGSKQQHRWEGVAIGVGAAILGHAIYQSHRAEARPPEVVYVTPEPDRRGHHGPRHRHGRWEWQKTWVPPVYERVWNPGHYNRHGDWVPGQWIDVKTTDGYWHRERVWIASSDRRPY